MRVASISTKRYRRLRFRLEVYYIFSMELQFTSRNGWFGYQYISTALVFIGGASLHCRALNSLRPASSSLKYMPLRRVTLCWYSASSSLGPSRERRRHNREEDSESRRNCGGTPAERILEARDISGELPNKIPGTSAIVVTQWVIKVVMTAIWGPEKNEASQTPLAASPAYQRAQQVWRNMTTRAHVKGAALARSQNTGNQQTTRNTSRERP
jgi:hypothetical protein